MQRAQRGRSGPIRSGRLCDADGIQASGDGTYLLVTADGARQSLDQGVDVLAYAG